MSELELLLSDIGEWADATEEQTGLRPTHMHVSWQFYDQLCDMDATSAIFTRHHITVVPG